MKLVFLMLQVIFIDDVFTEKGEMKGYNYFILFLDQNIFHLVLGLLNFGLNLARFLFRVFRAHIPQSPYICS